MSLYVLVMHSKSHALSPHPPAAASYAAYVLEERMARTPEAVAGFLSDLARDLRPLAEADLAGLLARKQVRQGRMRGEGRSLMLRAAQAEEGPESGPITMADYRCGLQPLAGRSPQTRAPPPHPPSPAPAVERRYYMEAELRERFSVDHDALKAYFPLPTVLEGARAVR